MRTFTVEDNWSGRRLDRWLSGHFPLLGYGGVRKCFREKRVRLNGAHVPPDVLLRAGDVVSLYVDEALLQPVAKRDAFLADFRPRLAILYRDEHIMVVDKRPGLLCHPDEREKVQTLLHHAQAYLYQQGLWRPDAPNSFPPALINRIDRFTGGIVLFALSKPAAEVLYGKMRTREIEKRYLCIVRGRLRLRAGVLRSWIAPRANGKGVVSLSSPGPGAKEAVTEYRVLSERGEMCLLECSLYTGRTNQIRAQLAAIGHPLLGDTQYGDKSFNERYHREYQALYAWKLGFHFTGDAGVLNSLNGAMWQVRNVPFVREYFPDAGELPGK